jgi:hypothetical protein
MIPIYIISKALEDRIHTPRLFLKAKIPFTLVVDTQDQEKEAHRLGCNNVVVSNCKGLNHTRNFVTELNGNNWFMELDDNITGFTMLSSKYWKSDHVDPTDKSVQWRKEFRTPCSPQLFVKYMNEISILCEQRKTVFGGVATTENPYFRANKYSYRRFVKTKACVIKGGSGILFKPPLSHDSYATAQVIALYGSVVVCNYLFYDAPWYEKGGLGSRKEREAKGLLTYLENTIQEFPGLVGKARGQNSALRILLTKDKSVNDWRRAHGYLSGGLF